MSGATIPKPRKLSEVSIRIAAAIKSVAFTTITPMVLGMMCLKMILKLEAPATLAASTNSRSRKDKNSALTRRAIPVQARAPSSKASDTASPPKLRLRTAPTTKIGRMITTSVARIRKLSSLPRKKPASAPTTTPITVERMPTISTTISDC